MFTGRRPRAFQFNCCVGMAILGQARVGCKKNRSYKSYRSYLGLRQ